ncbi:MAG: hypothetical protein GXX91_02025 [Verrucomicrobiaceae bacterium]|nr:hypothetical protein [Verrucomicrobiaceae bacterium]
MKTIPLFPLFPLFVLGLASCVVALAPASAQDAVANFSINVFADDNQNLAYDEDDTMVPGATVRLIRLPDDKVVATAITGRDGVYAFQNIPYGQYQVIVTFPSGFSVASATFAVNAATQADGLALFVPVVDRETLPRFANLHAINPATLSGDSSEVSPFAP